MAGRLSTFAALALALIAAAGGDALSAAGPLTWCGAATAADRADAVTGAQVHVIYAVPADGTDRFPELASAIVTDIGWIDTWWRREDPLRVPRFDLLAEAGCAGTLAALDLSSVRLPQPAAHYAALGTRVPRLIEDLAPMHSHPRKKYLVYYDGDLSTADRACGATQNSPQAGGRDGYATVFLRCGTELPLGSGRMGAVVAAHELTHSFGALSRAIPGPPNACPDDRGHVCDDRRDIISPSATAPTLDDLYLDVNDDDYYGHNGRWWDVQDSQWLRLTSPHFHPLALTVSGPGVVVADLPGLGDCSRECATEWEAGTLVRLTAKPSPGAVFAGWTGSCFDLTTCAVRMDAARLVEARFVRAFRLAVVKGGAGDGVVTSSPAAIRCGTSCAGEFAEASSVVLVARAAKGSRFVGWTGACRGTTARCTVRVARDSTVRAIFAR